MRPFTWLMTTLIITVTTTLFATTWLVTTDAGLRWLIAFSTNYLPGELTVDRVSGPLIGPLLLENVQYRSDHISVAADSIKLDWHAAALTTGTAHINYLVMHSVSVVSTDGQMAHTEQPPFTLPDIRIPLRVKVDDLTVTALSVATGKTATEFDRVDIVAHTQFEKIHVGRLRILADTGEFSLNGTIVPFGDYPHELITIWRFSPPEGPAVSGQGSIHGTIHNTTITQTIREPILTELAVRVTSPVEDLRWQASVRSDTFDIRSIDSSWPPISGSLDLEGSGTLTNFDSRGRINILHEEWESLKGEFSVSGNNSGAIHIARLDVTASRTGGLAQLTGAWQPDDKFGRFDGNIAWQGLMWPDVDTALVSSPAGRMRINGTPNRYSVTAEGEFRAAFPDSFTPVAGNKSHEQVPNQRSTDLPVNFTLEGEGTSSGVQVSKLALKTLGGNIIGNLGFSWDPEIRWNTSIHSSDLNPAGLDVRWPGRISLTAESSGHLTASGPVGTIHVGRLGGVVRERSFQADGGLSINGTVVDIMDTQLVSGQSRLTLSGRIADQFDVRLGIQSPDLQDIHPDAAGLLNATGTLSGARRAPRLRVNIDGHKLSYRDNAVANIGGTADVQLVEWAIPSVKLSADSVTFGSMRFDTLHLEGSGTRQSGGVTLLAVSPNVTVVANALSQAQNDETRVTFDRLDVLGTDGVVWRLDKPGSIIITSGRLATRQLCWSQPHGTGTGCIEAKYHLQDWNVSGSFNAVALQPFSMYFPQQPVWVGAASVRFSAEGHPERGTSGDVVALLDEGELSYPLPDGETGTWRYRDGKFTARLGPDGLESELLVRMGNSDRIDTRVALPGFRPDTFDPALQPVRGSINARISKTGLIELLVPEVQQSRGDIVVATTLEGTLSAARVDGHIDLTEGQFQIPRLGLTVSELTLHGESLGTDSFRYHLSGRSGEGVVHVTGVTKLDSRSGWPTELSITGSEVEVSRIPEARINVSPDIQVRIANDEVHVEGLVTVPYARLQPKDTSGAVSVSDDELIMGTDPIPQNRWRIFTRVRVVLGDRVSLYGFGFEGRIAGNLLLVDRPGDVTTAAGELNVTDGRYRAYGQRLSIERGLLLFTGGPVSNPGLELRAVRHVDNVTAGIRVAGTLRNPNFEIFSSPAMGETDALSYLVLGRPLESGSSEDARLVAQAALLLSLKGGDFLARRIGDRFGFDEMRIETADTGDQASLVIGRYLSPRLYVSYGVGLIDSINTFNARYELSRHWQLRAESGLHQSTDAVYTTER